jgi:hypothetical protein
VGKTVQPVSLYEAQLHDRLKPPHFTVDVSALVQVTLKAAGANDVVIDVKNISRAVGHRKAEGIRGPLKVVFESLPPRVVPVNIAGHTASRAPYVLIEVNDLLPGEDTAGVVHLRTALPAGAKFKIKVFAAGVFPVPSQEL